MNNSSVNTGSSHPRVKNKGVALVVALVLLVVVTLVGLAAIRGTTMQQQMTSNFYDREIAFQSAEAALRAGESLVLNDPTDATIRDCRPVNNKVCASDPFTDTDQSTVTVQTLATSQFDAGALASGQPQFVVENMGDFADANGSVKQLSGCASYGGCGAGANSTYFRITARSGSPANSANRAAVTLQSTFRD